MKSNNGQQESTGVRKDKHTTSGNTIQGPKQ